jgi:hypothetical protein
MESKYAHLSREQLEQLLDKYQNTRKLGLVWEREELESQQDLYEYVAQYGVCLELIPDSDAVLMQKVEVEGKLIWRGPCKHCGTTHWAWAI